MSTHHELYLGIERVIDLFLIKSNVLASRVPDEVNEQNTVRYMVDNTDELQVSHMGSETYVTFRGDRYNIITDAVRLCTEKLAFQCGGWVMGEKTSVETGNGIIFSPGTEIAKFMIITQNTLRIVFLNGDDSMHLTADWNLESSKKVNYGPFLDHSKETDTQHTVSRIKE